MGVSFDVRWAAPPTSLGSPPTAPKVLILLGLYNGERYLSEQLNSFLWQTCSGWGLIVSDDGSTDGGAALARDFAARHSNHPVEVIEGPRRGYGFNYQHLTTVALGRAPYLAWCDQDDVWFPDKLERGIEKLDRVPAGVPAIYCARTLICDEKLHVLGESKLFARPPSFAHALVQSLAGGNTMILNAAAANLFVRVTQDARTIIAHDWLLYQVVAAMGGTILYDTRPVLAYRQHGTSLIGSNLPLRSRVKRLAGLFGGHFSSWIDANLAVLERFDGLLTDETRAVLADFEAARSGPRVLRPARLWSSGVYRQSRAETFAIFLANLLGRL